MLIHSFGTLDNNAVLRHLAADSRKPDIDDPMTHSTAFIGGSAVWSLCRRHLGVVIGDDSIIRLIRPGTQVDNLERRIMERGDRQAAAHRTGAHGTRSGWVSLANGAPSWGLVDRPTYAEKGGLSEPHFSGAPAAQFQAGLSTSNPLRSAARQ